MIVDHLAHSSTYDVLGPRFARAFSFLRDLPTDIAIGKYELDGENVFAMVQEYQTAPSPERKFEAHRRHIDIQFIVQGSEILYYRPIETLTAESEGFIEARDVTFYHHADDRPVYLGAGDFVVLWPQDGHKPGCHWDTESPVRKVVVKIRVD